MLDKWIEVFGKDRATGVGAIDLVEMEHELLEEKDDEVQDEPGHTTADDSVNQPQSNDIHQAPTYMNKKRKSKLSDDIQPLCNLLSLMHKDTNERLDGLADQLGYQSKLGKAREEVYALVEVIPDLSLDEQFDVGDILVKETACLEYFKGLPVEKRAAYVHRLLRMKK